MDDEDIILRARIAELLSEMYPNRRRSAYSSTEPRLSPQPHIDELERRQKIPEALLMQYNRIYGTEYDSASWQQLYRQTKPEPFYEEAFTLLKEQNNKRNPNTFKIELVLSLVLVVLKIGIGMYYFHDCPVSKMIPIILIFDALRSADLLFFLPIFEETRTRRIIFVSVIGFSRIFGLLWPLFGIYWTFRNFFSLTTDASRMDSSNYCNFRLYYLIVFFIGFPIPFIYPIYWCLLGIDVILDKVLQNKLMHHAATKRTTTDVKSEQSHKSTTEE